MRWIPMAAGVAAGVAVVVPTRMPAAPVGAGRAGEWVEEERRHQTLQFGPGAPRSLEIDTVWGSIDLAAGDGPGADVVVRRSVSAETPEAREAAAREVRLVVTDHAPALRLYVDGPFRERRARGRRPDGAGYQVRYDFEVRLPPDVRVRLRTVNAGDVRARGIGAGFDVRNVNGAVALLDVAGGGEARTVNGSVMIVFRENPREAVRLATLNGDVTAQFAPGLSADLWVQAAHGDVLTDVDVVRVPAPAPVVERRGARTVWRIAPSVGLRAGAGGPAVRMETFNGNILIRRGDR